MDDELEKKFSFPNADTFSRNTEQPSGTVSTRPGGTGSTGGSAEEQQSNRPRPLVHITDALSLSKEKTDDAPNIRTFQADIADAIKNDNVSMIKMALSEKSRQDRQGNFSQTVQAEKNSTLFYVASVGIAVLVLMLFGGILIYMNSKDANTEAGITAKTTEPIIYTEDAIMVSTDNRDNDDIERVVKKEKEVKMDLGSMKAVKFTAGTGTSTQLLTTTDFLSLMKARVSDSLIRALESDFLLGLYSFNPYDTFMVVKVNSYDSAFAGMLQWENSMESDIGGLIITPRKILTPENTQFKANAELGQTAVGTSSTKAVATFQKHIFIDKVMQNKDSRVLIDERGTVLMLYTFIDKQTLVIASSDKALREIIFRLTTGRIIR